MNGIKLKIFLWLCLNFFSAGESIAFFSKFLLKDEIRNDNKKMAIVNKYGTEAFTRVTPIINLSGCVALFTIKFRCGTFLTIKE